VAGHGRWRTLARLAPIYAWQDASVTTELAVLDVLPGQEDEFEIAFDEAKRLISSMAGFKSLDLQRCLENSTRYFLLVVWERLEDHTDGFRGSPEYEEWRRLLHHFYESFPTVEHFRLVTHIEET
jgi:heme-degrading monooxygenase HmoA